MQDSRLIRIALFLFFVAVSLVYAVFVEVRGDAIRENLTVIMQKYGVTTQSTTWDVIQTWDVSNTWQDMIEGTWEVVDENDSFLDDILGTWEQRILTWTELYYGTIDVFRSLWIRYEYVLKDSTYDIFYVYVGTGKTYDIPDLVRWIWWKTIEIYARNDIINNLYFWDRVTFVELPWVSPTITSLFVRMGADLWFIQDVTWEYKTHKRHIRKVFTWN